MTEATLADYSPDIGDERTYYVKVDRTSDGSDTTLVEYLRLGAPSEEADWDSTTLMETHAIESFNEDDILTNLDNDIGIAGTFEYTSGDAFELVEGDSFRRVHGDDYVVVGAQHMIYTDAAIVSGFSKGVLSGTIDYTMSRATEFSSALAASLSFNGGVQYDANATLALGSTTGLSADINFGAGVEVSHALKAEISANGGFENATSGLNHSEKPVYFGEKSLTLGLDDDALRTQWKVLFGSLATLMQLADLTFSANGAAAAIGIERFSRKPRAVDAHVDIAQITATTQGTLALIASLFAFFAGRIQSKKADALSGNIGAKPYARIEKPDIVGGGNKITLDTGEGASIVMEKDKITLKAAEVEVDTTAAGNARGIAIKSGDSMELRSAGTMDIISGAATLLESKGGDLTIDAGAKNVSSTAAKWKQTGKFEAGETTLGKTTLGATTATSIQLNGKPVATQELVVNSNKNLTQEIKDAKLDVHNEAMGWALELVQLFTDGPPSIPGT